MGELFGVERDAVQVAQVLAVLADHLAMKEAGVDRALAQEGGAAAERVLAYLRDLRGPGDGVAIAYPIWLGPWRDWCPPRGQVLHDPRVRVPRRTPAERRTPADRRAYGDCRAYRDCRVTGDPGE